MSKITTIALTTAISTAALVGLPPAANALLIAQGIAPGNFTFAAGAVFVPINGASTVVGFNLPAATRVIITFSAECSVNAPAGNNSAWVDIDVQVDGLARSPTNTTADAFCDANGTAGFDGWVRPSITIPVSLRAGNHTVRIVGRTNAGATGGWISDRALVVER